MWTYLPPTITETALPLSKFCLVFSSPELRSFSNSSMNHAAMSGSSTFVWVYCCQQRSFSGDERKSLPAAAFPFDYHKRRSSRSSLLLAKSKVKMRTPNEESKSQHWEGQGGPRPNVAGLLHYAVFQISSCWSFHWRQIRPLNQMQTIAWYRSPRQVGSRMRRWLAQAWIFAGESVVDIL